MPQDEKNLDILTGKWTCLIIKHLLTGKKRFNELRKLLHDVNARSLTYNLRNLEKQGLITRIVAPTVPITVEYALTAKGEDLKDVICSFFSWSEKWSL